MGPDKAIDGIVNRDAAKPDQSRWSTNMGTTPMVLTIDLKRLVNLKLNGKEKILKVLILVFLMIIMNIHQYILNQMIAISLR